MKRFITPLAVVIAAAAFASPASASGLNQRQARSVAADAVATVAVKFRADLAPVTGSGVLSCRRARQLRGSWYCEVAVTLTGDHAFYNTVRVTPRGRVVWAGPFIKD